MPLIECSFCQRTFKSLQGLGAHRTQYKPCRLAWEEYLEQFDEDPRPQPAFTLEDDDDDVMNLQADDAFDDPGPLPLPGMDWQPIRAEDEESVASSCSNKVKSVCGTSDSDNSDAESGEGDGSDDDFEHADQEKPMDDANEENQVIDYYDPPPGAIIGHKEGRFTSLLNSPQRVAAMGIHYPFANEEEFELANWMHESGMPMSRMDSFLKLRYVGYTFCSLYLSNLPKDSSTTTLIQKWKGFASYDRAAAGSRPTMDGTRNHSRLGRTV